MALSGDTIWEIRVDGDDNNGGGYRVTAGTTDYSQRNKPILELFDGETPDKDSAMLKSPRGGFTAQMVGNICHIYNGTNVVPGWYEIIAFIDTNTVLLDRPPDDGAGCVTGATVRVGGALASIGAIGYIWKLSDTAAPGQRVFIRGGNGVSYVLKTSFPNVSGGWLDIADTNMNDKGFYIKGYDSAYGRPWCNGIPPEIIVDKHTRFVIKLTGSEFNSQSCTFLSVKILTKEKDITAFAGQNHYAQFVKCECSSKYIKHVQGFCKCSVISCYVRNCEFGFYCCEGLYNIAEDCVVGFGFGHYYALSLAKNCSVGFYNQHIVGLCVAYGGVEGFKSTGCIYFNCVGTKQASHAFVHMSFSDSSSYIVNGSNLTRDLAVLFGRLANVDISGFRVFKTDLEFDAVVEYETKLRAISIDELKEAQEDKIMEHKDQSEDFSVDENK